MSITTIIKCGVVALAVILYTEAIFGTEASLERQLVERIVASWRARQKEIEAIRSRTAIEFFYGKGYVNAYEFDQGMSATEPSHRKTCRLMTSGARGISIFTSNTRGNNFTGWKSMESTSPLRRLH